MKDRHRRAGRPARLLLLPLLLFSPTSAKAEEAAGTDRVIPKLALVDHPDQFYALYLPAGAPEKPLPLLLVLDPRGRAVEALERFLPPARRLGWIVASSYESRSDEGSEVNLAAVPALVNDLQKRLAFDTRRIYLAGFSGTARTAWDVARQLGDHAAGVLASCGGLPHGEKATRPSFAYFGNTGTLDFNFGEMLQLEQDFARLGATRRFEIFAGEHSWAPPEMMSRALHWFELQAMKAGRRPRDQAFVLELYQNELQRAETLTGLDRWQAFDQLVRDFEGLRDLGELEAKLAASAKDPAVRAAKKERERLLALEEGYRLRIAEWRRAFLETDLPLALNRSLAMLLLPSLARDASEKEAGSTTERALSAQRRLRLALSETAHYLPARLEAQSSFRHAAASRELAQYIRQKLEEASTQPADPSDPSDRSDPSDSQLHFW